MKMLACLLRPLVLIALCCLTLPAFAQTKTCDALKGEQRTAATNVLKSQHPYDCCDGTIAECLTKKPVCALAVRLANDVCRRAAAGQSQREIERELARRAASALAPKLTVDTTQVAVAGDVNAPVEIVVYLCARCPFCAKLVPQLYASVTQGRLKGKAKLIVRPFPIRSHKHSTLAAKAMLAADRMGQFWPYLMYLYAHFDEFDPDTLVASAGKAGLDPERFRALLADPGIENTLVASKKEGIRNHVDATPTLLINRRKYEAEHALPAVEDFVEE
ncbi:MAG TPA: thioredoxin domain-containing protein, partial [Polyangiaceae bacterium]|nr:thioredoxin domain-containing protein [Polyangiaceae bacterium]